MSDTYRYGIDLGTTNSVIARCDASGLHVFTNPTDFGKKTLPSAVAWRKDRLLVGEKARDLAAKPQGKGNSFAGFKRKMGTSEAFPVQATGTTVTPVDLSAEVLKELRRFVADDPNFTSAIVTIPASFDVMQASATVDAAQKAGIKHVALLQEPIAASLAFANLVAKKAIEGKWLVYDLGGGTFDVALLEAGQDQLRVIDHEGDNFLGGRDFDAMLLREYVVPAIERKFAFRKQPLIDTLVRASGRHNHIYEAMLRLAEGAKITLTTRESVDLEIEGLSDFVDDDGNDVSLVVTVTRSDFETVIRPSIDRSISMVSGLLGRNRMSGRDLAFVLLVGGSTYIPMIRKRLEETLETKVRSDVDPTTAVAEGAAFYAASKAIEKTPTVDARVPQANGIVLKASYQRSSRDPEEYYAAKVDGWRPDLRYRVVRRDGGFDTGLKPLEKRITEDLPLREGEYNYFDITISDATGRSVTVIDGEIAIAHGKFSVAGQTLPHDICLERDDLSAGRTRCDLLFRRNVTLPADGKPRRPYSIGRTIIKGSNEALIIRVLQGPEDSRPDACLIVGELRIPGNKLEKDLFQGASLDVSATITENQRIMVRATLPDIGQTFQEIFEIKTRQAPTETVADHLQMLETEAAEALKTAEDEDDFERAKPLKEIVHKARDVQKRLSAVAKDDTTDARYQLEDEKRRIAVDLARVTGDNELRAALAEFETAMAETEKLVKTSGNDADKQLYEVLAAARSTFTSSPDPKRVREAISQARRIYWGILLRDIKFLAGWFESMAEQAHTLNDQKNVQMHLDHGKQHIREANAPALRETCFALMQLLPNREQGEYRGMVGFY